MAEQGKGKSAAAVAAERRPAVPGGKVISYFTDFDGQFNSPAIGYDVNKFGDVIRKFVVADPIPKDPNPESSTNQAVAKGKDADVELQRADVELVMDQLEVSKKEAESALRSTKGDVIAALIALTAPTICP